MSKILRLGAALLALGVAFPCGAGSGSAPPTLNYVAYANFDGARAGRGSPPIQLHFSKAPTVAELTRLYPPALRGGFAANLRCRLSGSLRLSSCMSVETDPAMPTVDATANKISKLFVVDADMSFSGPRESASVDLFLHVDDHQVSTTGHQPCLPPMCVSTIPPPPPPTAPGAH